MSGTRSRGDLARERSRAGAPRQREGEGGAVVMIFALVFTIIVGMVLAGMIVGRESIVRRELQTAADATALAYAYSIEQHGKPASSPRSAPALSLIGPNTSLVAAPQFNHYHRSNGPLALSSGNEHRVVARVDLAGTFDSSQTWFQRLFTIRARAYAQVNEQVFSEQWPALTIILDASESMKLPILAATGRTAFEVMSDALQRYFNSTLPVRNGLVIFNDLVRRQVAPMGFNANNKAAIEWAFASFGGPSGQTNTQAALRAARLQQEAVTVGRNVLLITDGEPTRSGPNPPECGPANDPCHFTAAETEANRVRNGVCQAALFTTEIRRTNYFPQLTNFLQNISGPAGSAGGDAGFMTASVQGELGLRLFMQTLTASICAFGPLDPAPGAPPDALRPRQTTPDLLSFDAGGAITRERVFAFIREAGGSELRIPPVRDRNLTNDAAFELVPNPVAPWEVYVVLTLRACEMLGELSDRTLVVRWDDAQLVPAP